MNGLRSASQIAYFKVWTVVILRKWNGEYKVLNHTIELQFFLNKQIEIENSGISL